MHRRVLLILLAGCFLSLALPVLAQTAPDFSGVESGSSSAAAEPKPKKSPVVYDPEITLPFFPAGPVDGTTFAKYIRAIFIVFIWSVGVLATVMVVYGGVRWVAAAGDAARINQAKDVVYNAIIGLVIALTSVTLLNLIDPRLVRFEGLTETDTVQVVGREFDGELSDTGVANLTSVGTDFKQCDKAWGDMDYPGTSNSCNLCSSGCGATAVATALARLGVPVTPPVVAQYALDIGARTKCANGTQTSLLVNKPNPAWGVSGKTIKSPDAAMRVLEAGSALVVSVRKLPVAGQCQNSKCGKGVCFCGGHYIVLTGKIGSTITVSDPSRNDIKTLDESTLRSHLSRNEFYQFSR